MSLLFHVAPVQEYYTMSSTDEEIEKSHSNLKVTGSRNRGPGAMDEEEAGRIRNSLSQNETNSQKRFKT